jgi:hypothetical protein
LGVQSPSKLALSVSSSSGEKLLVDVNDHDGARTLTQLISENSPSGELSSNGEMFIPAAIGSNVSMSISARPISAFEADSHHKSFFLELFCYRHSGNQCMPK